MNTQQNSLNETLKNKAFIAIAAIIAISWATPMNFQGEGTASILIGAVLIGFNLVRRQNGLAMGKGSFMIGSFLISLGWHEASPFYFQVGSDWATEIPMIFPILVILLFASAIFDKLQSNKSA